MWKPNLRNCVNSYHISISDSQHFQASLSAAVSMDSAHLSLRMLSWYEMILPGTWYSFKCGIGRRFANDARLTKMSGFVKDGPLFYNI